MLYQNALTKTEDDDFYTFLPHIYTKLAKAYQNLSDWYEIDDPEANLNK